MNDMSRVPVPQQAGQPWTEAEDSLAIRMAVQMSDAPRAEIARAIHEALPSRSVQAINYRLAHILDHAIQQARRADTSRGPAEWGLPLDADLTGTQNGVRARLNQLGYPDGWDPAQDSVLVLGLGRGSKLDMLAKVLNRPKTDLIRRWRDLVFAVCEIEGAALTIEETALLNTEIRERAARFRGVAA